MKIKHESNFDVVRAAEHYSIKDGVAVKYVCTTDLHESDQPYDVFYRATPHPEFGNKYFGLIQRHGTVYICNADIVETLEFGMIQDKQGDWHYSKSHHDFNVIDNGHFIDGGRLYIRCNTGYSLFKVKDGEFVEVGNNEWTEP